MVAERLGGYNEQEYNAPLYNDNDIFLSLSEAITSTDGTIPNDITSLKTELITLIDNLQKYFNGAIFADTLTPTDVLLNQAQLVKLESMSLTDERTMVLAKLLLETMTISDVRAILTDKPLTDFIILLDNLTKQITNKQLPMESIRLNDWLEIRNAPQSDPWN